MGKKLTEVASRLAAKPEAQRQIIYIVDFENIPKTDVAALLRKKHVAMVVLAANRTNTVTPETLQTIEANPDRVDVIIGRITRKEFVDKLVTAKIGEYAFRYPDAEIIVLANDKDYADLAKHLNDHWERTVPIKHVAPAKPKARARRKTKAKANEATAETPKPKARTRTRRKIETPEPADTPPKPKTRTRTRRKIETTEAAPAESKAKTKAKPKAKAKPKTEPKAKAKPKTEPKAKTKPKAKAKAKAPDTKPITNPDAEAVRALLANLPKQRLPRSEAALLNAVRNYRESVGLQSRPSTIVKHLQECGVIDAETSPLEYIL